MSLKLQTIHQKPSLCVFTNDLIASHHAACKKFMSRREICDRLHWDLLNNGALLLNLQEKQTAVENFENKDYLNLMEEKTSKRANFKVLLLQYSFVFLYFILFIFL